MLSDSVRNMVVHVALPGGSMTAVLSGQSDVVLRFADGYYERASEPDLESKMEALARLLWAERTREYHRALRTAFAAPTLEAPAPVGRRDIEFTEASEAMVASGRSADGRIEISVRGMRQWTVRIMPGTVRALDQERFIAGVREAASALINDQRQQMLLLKTRVYA